MSETEMPCEPRMIDDAEYANEVTLNHQLRLI